MRTEGWVNVWDRVLPDGWDSICGAPKVCAGARRGGLAEVTDGWVLGPWGTGGGRWVYSKHDGTPLEDLKQGKNMI